MIILKSPLQESLESSICLIKEKINKIPEGGEYCISDIAKRYIGGKYMRSRIAIICGKLAGCSDIDKITDIATAIELMHVATLLHDDVIDGNGLRRNKKSAPSEWGNSYTILAGNFLMLNALDIMVRYSSSYASLAIKCTNNLIKGEVIQDLGCGNVNLSLSEYENINSLKTGMLFALSSSILFADSSNYELMFDFGNRFGELFQITDDIGDYMLSEKELGKAPMQDIKSKKLTLPAITIINNHPNSATQRYIESKNVKFSSALSDEIHKELQVHKHRMMEFISGRYEQLSKTVKRIHNNINNLDATEALEEYAKAYHTKCKNMLS